MSFCLSRSINPRKVFLIHKSEMEGRLDTVFYHPKYRANEAEIKSSKWGCTDVGKLAIRIADGPFGSDLKVDEYQKEGHPLLRVSNIRTGEIGGDLVYLSAEKHTQLKRSRVFPDDVLLTKAGAILGYSAVFPDHLGEGNITSHLVTITCGAEINPHYLSHFFRSLPGQLQIYRWGNKSTRPELNTNEVKNILITTPPLGIQEKIVLMLEQAYAAKKTKEAEARALLDSIDDYLLTELGIDLPEESSNVLKDRIFTRPASEVSGGRFDPKPYSEDRLDSIQSVCEGVYAPVLLGDLVVIRPEKINGNIEGSRYIGLENVEGKTGHWIPSLEVSDEIGSASVFFRGDILFSKLRPYLNKVFFAEFSGVCSTEFLVLNGYLCEGQFLADFLRSKIIVRQTQCLMSGNTLPRLSVDDVRRLLIPVPPKKVQQAIADHISAIRSKAKQLQEEAVAGLEQAKAEVEKMILGVG